MHNLELVNTPEFWQLKYGLDEAKGRYGLDYCIQRVAGGQPLARNMFKLIDKLFFADKRKPGYVYVRPEYQDSNLMLEYVERQVYEDA